MSYKNSVLGIYYSVFKGVTKKDTAESPTSDLNRRKRPYLTHTTALRYDDGSFITDNATAEDAPFFEQ